MPRGVLLFRTERTGRGRGRDFIPPPGGGPKGARFNKGRVTKRARCSSNRAYETESKLPMKTHRVLVAVLILALPILSYGYESESKGTPSALDQGGTVEVIPRTIIIEQLKTEGSATFPSKVVLFDYGSAKLTDPSHMQLMEIAAALKDPSLSEVPFFYVDGHTCSVGTDERNCRLSWRRSMSVINFLVEAGAVPHQRIRPRGFGESLPVASNTSEQGREQNRRVVVKRGDLDEEDIRAEECHYSDAP